MLELLICCIFLLNQTGHRLLALFWCLVWSLEGSGRNLCALGFCTYQVQTWLWGSLFFQQGMLGHIIWEHVHMIQVDHWICSTSCNQCRLLMFYDKCSYATWGNFPSVEWILVNIIITTNCADNILWLVDSNYFKLSIDHHLWTVRPVVKDLFMLKTKCLWIFKLWHSYLCHKTWDMYHPPPICLWYWGVQVHPNSHILWQR